MKKQIYLLFVLALMSAKLFAQTPILGDWVTVDDKTGKEI